MSGWKSMNHQSTMTCLEELDPLSQASQSVLFEVCTQSPYDDARRVAVDKLKSQSLLVKVAFHEPDEELCKAAIRKLDDDSSLMQVAEYIYDDHYLCSMAINRINNQDMLFHIAQNHTYTECRLAAVKRLDKQGPLQRIARHNSNPEVRVCAVGTLRDQQELARIAATDPSSWVRHSAIGRLEDYGLLALIVKENSSYPMRLAALIRLKEIGQSRRIDREIVEGLLPLLGESAMVEVLIELAQHAGVDWVAKSTPETVHALFTALREDKGWQNSIAMEQAMRLIDQARPDLREALRGYQWVDPYTNGSYALN